MSIKIFDSEKDIEDAIRASLEARIIASATILPIGKQEAVAKALNEIEDKSGIVGQVLAEITPDKHPELMYGSAILASTVWNGNDDIFLPTEMWAARYTPIHQIFDQGHKRTEIIGHIIDARCKDEDGEIIKGYECPGFFDIEVDWVMYHYIFPEIAKAIRENAPDGKLAVSMEARMKGFDYGILSDNNEFSVIKRNKETSFLTKSLKAFGGTGEYKGKRLGRVLRNFVFNGMGNVTVPANERSQYTVLDGKVLAEHTSFNDLACIESSSTDNNTAIFFVPQISEQRDTKGKDMKFENVDQAVAYIETLTKQIETLKNSETQKTIDSLNVQITSAKADIEKLEKQLKVEIEKNTTVASQLSASETAREDLEVKLADTNKQLGAKITELNKIANEKAAAEAAKLGSDRVAELKSFGMKFADEAAEATKLATLSDDAYANIAGYAKQVKTVTDAANANKTEAEKKAEAEAQAKADLAKAKEDRSTNVEISDNDKNEGQTIASIVEKAFKSSKTRKLPFVTKKD